MHRDYSEEWCKDNSWVLSVLPARTGGIQIQECIQGWDCYHAPAAEEAV